MKRISLVILLFVFSLMSGICCLMSEAYAEIPHLINYQGRFTDQDDKPLDGIYEVTFMIYDVEAGGAPIWTEEHTAVDIDSGTLSVMLGSITDLDLAFEKPYFLEIKVEDEVMSPRQRINSVGYALRAEISERLETECIIDAKGGLVIERRTSDPQNPVEGQIWIRTDL